MRILLLSVALLATATAYADWQPISADELQMKSEPKAPQAPAIYLYRQVDRDDEASYETIYARIKVLNEEGRKYADIEVPYVKSSESIRNVAARTIQPDGTTVDFDGKVYDKELLKARRYKVAAKTFTLPNVQIGSIIEYRYRRVLPEHYVFDSRWLLSEDLFTRFAKFSLRPSPMLTLRWSWPMGLPPNTEAPKKTGDLIRMETHDLPAFVTEDFMPPHDVMKFRVEFIYEENGGTADQGRYWRDFGKRRNHKLETFLGNRRALEPMIGQIVAAQDTPEARLRKLYARVQQVRNLSYERDKSEQETEREDLDENDRAKEVLERGYGSGNEITWAFLALARAAGFEAEGLLVATRDRYFFDPRMLNAGQLRSNVAIVKLDGKDVFLDPGALYTPFGALPWYETAVRGLRLNDTGGTWTSTPLPHAADSRILSKVVVKLNGEGSLEGKATVTYTGLEAASRRVAERHDDETERRKFLEDEIKGDVASGIDVKLTNTPDWTSSETALVAEYDFKVPGWASGAGKRTLLPIGVFGSGEKHMFEHAARVQPLCFDYPHERTDEVAIELPKGWRVNSLPTARQKDLKVAIYTISAQEADGMLNLRRDLTIDFFMAEAKYYGVMRDFFQTVRAGDQDQVILMSGDTAPGAD